MLAYHNDPQLKQQILQQLQRHYDADEIVKGQYWQDGKGCAVGCTLHTDQHKEYETRFGIPEILAHLEDAIFERLPNDLAKNWPMRFMSAINVGADLSTIWRDFALWMLVDPVDGVIQYTTPGTDAHHAIMQVAQLYQDGHTQQQMRDASFAARAAALTRAGLQQHSLVEAVSASDAAANAAAASFAGFAASVYSTTAAASFASFAAAAYAAYNVAAAAYYAVHDALGAAHAAHAAHYYSAYAGAHATRDAVRDAAYIKISNKLIELLEKQEVKHVSLP